VKGNHPTVERANTMAARVLTRKYCAALKAARWIGAITLTLLMGAGIATPSAYPEITQAANGASAFVEITAAPDPLQGAIWTPLGLVATVSPGAALTYAVQVTADVHPSATGYWNNHDVLVNETGSANSNVQYPVTAVRLFVTNYVSGSVHLGTGKWP
jgi:hypothetical protein